MALGLKPSKRRGEHYKLALKAFEELKRANLLKKTSTERQLEQAVVAHLESSTTLSKYLITQVDDGAVEKISHAHLFGFKHRPDVTIGNDGTAIEIKVLTNSTSVRDVLGQAIAYRTRYRFVILVLIDQTPGKKVVELCSNPMSSEAKLLHGLAEAFNIMTVVGPAGKQKNIGFSGPTRSHADSGSRVSASSQSPTKAEDESCNQD
ncbi:MAG TPA: hypothetical protein VJL29_13640 [Thermoguttaceae bacterium]|nr:hypothetical protein [Thermoguttaceae bacterium]